MIPASRCWPGSSRITPPFPMHGLHSDLPWDIVPISAELCVNIGTPQQTNCVVKNSFCSNARTDPFFTGWGAADTPCIWNAIIATMARVRPKLNNRRGLKLESIIGNSLAAVLGRFSFHPIKHPFPGSLIRALSWRRSRWG